MRGMQNLLPEPPATQLPAQVEADKALEYLRAADSPERDSVNAP